MPTFELLQGDALDTLKLIPDGVCNTCVTSPPYWRLRDYKHPGQLGQEKTPEEYVEKLVEVFSEVRRVLADDGTCWLNVGTTYSSKKIESNDYIIRRDLPEHQRCQIAQAMSSMWGAYVLPEQALRSLLRQISVQAGKLRNEIVPNVRADIHSVHKLEGKILQSEVQTSKSPAAHGEGRTMPLLRKSGVSTALLFEKEQGKKGVLQPEMLVQTQPSTQSCGMERESDRSGQQTVLQVAEGHLEAGRETVSSMSYDCEVGGASHTSVRSVQEGTVENQQRSNAVSELSQKGKREGIGVCRDAISCSQCARYGLAGLKFRKSTIPKGFEQFCEPLHVLNPKNDALIPERLAIALQQDGWHVRCVIIWLKLGSVPEACHDRPSRNHEYLFLLAKNPKYYYDYDAVLEPHTNPWAIDCIKKAQETGTTGRPRSNPFSKEERRAKGTSGITRAEYGALMNPKGKNRRTVWPIKPARSPVKHYSMFPEDLVKPCILAGCPENGLVLDPFCGTATTGVVALKHKRNFVGIELTDSSINLARENLNSILSNLQLRANENSFPSGEQQTADSSVVVSSELHGDSGFPSPEDPRKV